NSTAAYMACHSTDGQVELAAPITNTFFPPGAVADSAGRSHVAWITRTATPAIATLHYAVYSADAGFSPVTTPYTAAVSNSFFPRPAAMGRDAIGAIHVVFNDSSSWVWGRLSQGTWTLESVPYALVSSLGASRVPELAV